MKTTKKKEPSRQQVWENANRKAGKCRCGRDRKLPHSQCRVCIARMRKRAGYKGGRTKYGKGRPPALTKKRRSRAVMDNIKITL